MNSKCQKIDLIIKLSGMKNNSVLEVTEGWSQVKEVISMSGPLADELREKIIFENPSLRYWKYEGSPHNPPDEGFICDEHSVAISFPVKK